MDICSHEFFFHRIRDEDNADDDENLRRKAALDDATESRDGAGDSQFGAKGDVALDQGEHNSNKCNDPTKNEKACVCKCVSARARPQERGGDACTSKLQVPSAIQKGMQMKRRKQSDRSCSQA
jgi:hypothetical protein